MILFFLPITVDKCQYWMDIEKKTLSSPNYPKHFFADGKGCEWLINAPEGNLISLEFELLDVNLCKFVTKHMIEMK